MFQRWKVVLLSTSLGLILFIANAFPVSIAQTNNFPIGLYMNYNIAVYIDDPLDYPDNEYDISYNFMSWINKENNVVEYSRNFDGVSGTFVRSLTDVHIEIPGNPPIWRNVTTWKIGDMYNLSGISYKVHHMVTTTVTGGYYEWFLLWNITQSGNPVNKTMLGYHSHLGILVDYDRETNSTDGSSRFEKQDLFLLGTNLYDYYPLITHSTPTTSTTSTISTSQPTTTPITTSDINGPIFTLPSMTVFLSVGIVVESIIIVLIMMRKQSSHI
jgi:hypothetical protein